MTLAPPDDSGTAETPSDDEAGVPQVVRHRTTLRRRQRRRRRLLAVQSAVTVVFVAAIIALGFVGWNSALRITGGRTNEVTDPAAPGYVAAAKPTAVTLIAFAGPSGGTPAPVPEGRGGDTDPAQPDDAESAGEEGAGAPAAAAGDIPAGESTLATMLLIIERSGDQGSTVVPIPSSTAVWTFEESPPALAKEVFASGGIDVLRLRLGAELSFGSTRAVTAPAQLISDLAGRSGPITIALPDDVLSGTSDEDAQVRYAAGELILEPDEVAGFMSFTGYGESGTNQSLRLELAWRELLGAADGSGPALDSDAGIDDDTQIATDVLGSMSDESPTFDLVPMEAVPLPVVPVVTLFRVDQAAMPGWVPDRVPFPVAAFPGQRARVMLSNGTEDPDLLKAVAPKVVKAGGEISFTGNAEQMDLTSSSVVYAAPEAESSANEIATSLGLTARRDPEAATNVDVVVIAGADLAGQSPP